MAAFFEEIGWKVFKVPETSTILLSGGVKFAELDECEVYNYQENLLKVMLQIEKTYFDLADTCHKNCIIICDRGAMDPSAYIEADKWKQIMDSNEMNIIQYRDERYDQILHLVSCASGAESFYTKANNKTRSEGLKLAREIDSKTKQVWVGHPYFDVIDNTVDFDGKVHKAIKAVCRRIGIDVGDRFAPDSIKRKFLVKCLPEDKVFPPFQDFDVVHDYLVVTDLDIGTQARLRRRGQNGRYTYMHTIRRPKIDDQVVEVRKKLNRRDYEMLLAQRDDTRQSVYKKRRCFLWKNQYFQMDVYKEPYHSRCKGLLLLETYTSKSAQGLQLPCFLSIEKEVTNDPEYSMYLLSLK
ncbi:TRPL translocation defect protein 14 isoform X2 [Exaiptasia diaphana]|nr:TRPL translocation defect protein 14 isoform X2 [Exaiptasia diaphana]